MPGYDGTGPCGKGPMTGRGDGYCMLKLSGSGTDLVQGFVGRPGRPFRFSADRRRGETAHGVRMLPTDVLNPLSEKSILLPLFFLRLQAFSARLAEFGWRVKRLEAMVGSRFRTDRDLLNGHSKTDCLRRT